MSLVYVIGTSDLPNIIETSVPVKEGEGVLIDQNKENI